MSTINASFGSSQSGSWSNGGTDTYQLTATAGGTVTINFIHPHGVGSDGVPIDISLLDDQGNVVVKQTLSGTNSFVTTIAAAGNYYLKVADGNPYHLNDGGTYVVTPTLSSESGVTYDGAANNTTPTAIASPMAAAIIGSLNVADVDIFKVHADNGGVLTLALQHPQGAGSTGLAIGIDVLDTAGNLVAQQDLHGDGSVLTTVPTAGDYYLKIADDSQYSSGHGGLYKLTPRLSASVGATYDGPNNNSTNSALNSPMGAPIIGTLSPQDVDVFKVHADSGGVLTLTLEHPQGIGNNGKAVGVDVIDSAGNVLISQSLQGSGAIVTTVDKAGDYYLKISDAIYDNGINGTYTLTPNLVGLPGVVYDGGANNTSSTALNAPLSTAIMGRVIHNNSDFFKFSAASAGVLTVNFLHPDGVGSAGHAINLDILDAGGKTVFSDTEHGSALLNIPLAGGGDYYLKIGEPTYYSNDDNGIYQLITGMSGNDGASLTGTGGADTFASTSGNDVINGAGGLDLVRYRGNSAEYQMTVAAVGTHVSDSAGRDGSDTLLNVERLQFSDKMVALDVDGVAGQAYRLYQAAFDRVPDQAGLGFWISRMDDGATLANVAEAFTHSQEFQQRYGSQPGNHELVAAFYANILHRAPDQAGLDYWDSILDNHLADAATVMTSFSVSAENVAQLAPAMAHGIGYILYT